MAFDYQTLKKFTTEAIIDTEVKQADIENNAVTEDKIANNAVNADKIANSAVDVTGTVVSGTLPINRGGTNQTSTGSSGQTLRVNSSANGLEWANSFGINRQVVYTGNNTWNRQSGTRYIHVQVVGGGGGGSGH